MLTIGIDPGLDGAIAVIDHNGFKGVYDMPTMERGSSSTVKRQVNTAALANLMRQLMEGHDLNEMMVAIERVQAMPKQGVASTFSLGHTAGAIEAVVCALRLPHTLVAPAKWKKRYGLTSEKNAGRTLAQRWYPEAPLDKQKDHNRAEAILLARFAQEEFA